MTKGMRTTRTVAIAAERLVAEIGRAHGPAVAAWAARGATPIDRFERAFTIIRRGRPCREAVQAAKDATRFVGNAPLRHRNGYACDLLDAIARTEES